MIGSLAAFVAVVAATLVFGAMSNLIPLTIFWRSQDLYQDPVMIRLANAVAAEDVQQIDGLVAQGADVNATGTRGLGLLMWAMAKNSPKGFARLLDHGANPLLPALDAPADAKPGRKMPFIAEYAAQNKSTAYLQALLDRGLDPNLNRANGTPLLFHAIESHAQWNVKVLLDAGADANRSSPDNVETPLQVAMLIRQLEIALLLIERGADPALKNRWGYSAIDVLTDPKQGYSADQRLMREKLLAELKRRGQL
jgi:ankyrin repeat protein